MQQKRTSFMNGYETTIALTNGKRRDPPAMESTLLDDEEPKPSWRERFLVNLGAKTMVDPTSKPFSFWNPTFVSAACAVLALLFTLIGALLVGSFYMGIQHNKYDEMQRQIERDRLEVNQRMLQNEIDTKKAKEMQILNSRHPEPETKEKK